MNEHVIQLLRRVIPFRFLPVEYKQYLAERLVREEYHAGDIIIQQHDTTDASVYLIESGSVDALDITDGGTVRVNSIHTDHYFGEWEPLFRIPRRLRITAREHTVCYRLDGDTFLQILQDSAEFSLAFGTTLRDKQGIFAAFDRFKTALLRSVDKGHISVAAMVGYYRELEPALHPRLADRRCIDIAALNYAVRRLPANLTRTFALLLTDELPAVYQHPEKYFPAIDTAARRRDIWELLPGKNLVLLRSGLSDLTDMLTCLCLYAVEAEKIRDRLDRPEMLAAIDAWLTDNPETRDLQAIQGFLEGLAFRPDEAAGLLQIWQEDTVSRLSDVLRHREMFSIDVRKQTNNWNSRRTDLWTAQVAQATRELLGCDPSEMAEDIRVHIISSNTHSVSNCLSPWFPRNAQEILDWAESVAHPVLGESWEHAGDQLYALVREYFRACPEQQQAYQAEGRRHGILSLRETASTGIQVQLIDCSRLAGIGIDPDVTPVPAGSKDFIVNIDYAFGEQAEHIMRNLAILFGRNVCSINFLGKAGALLGRRGDVLAPTAFIEQTSDMFQPVPAPSQAALKDLQHRLPGRQVHPGPMLTVEGTLLQNSMMLHFYHSIWGCTGIEMEGTHYYRQVLESTQIGVIPEDVDLRFFYYVSDLPMDHGSSLAARMGPAEGVPPLYAITRHILSEIFSSSGQAPAQPV
ncbi:cyclic nucleotide-binding domain-containing protein [Spirochaeta africana]|uniref:Cyclic nucleotide-binding protein n=1 Tax=Spirochaeta africana (strain ATCC 700263 / DSM 8902 / Z-7692) TaxID=889378 RepID=H9UMD8_SPIAZ|nr:cyclic nucleotide-binding domain-containing protein [Spirochaeta africana]AFG38681.1 cyclic nucleotide-binding protein [Spirochaeta africana DSM 8902]